MRRGGWRTNRKTGGHFYSYGYWHTNRKTKRYIYSHGRYSKYNKRYPTKIGNDVIQRQPKQYKNSMRKIRQQKQLKTSTILSVLGQVPLISEIHAAYTTADFLWTNWKLFSDLYSTYDKKGTIGLAKAVGTDTVKDCLTDFQTDIFWTQISKIVPAPFQPEVKACFSKVVERITEAEVDFVSNFLIEQNRKK